MSGLHCLHCQFPPPQQLFCVLDFVLKHLTRPIKVRSSYNFSELEVTIRIEILCESSHLSKASILVFSSFSLSRDLSISFRSDCLCIYMFFSSILKRGNENNTFRT